MSITNLIKYTTSLVNDDVYAKNSRSHYPYNLAIEKELDPVAKVLWRAMTKKVRMENLLCLNHRRGIDVQERPPLRPNYPHPSDVCGILILEKLYDIESVLAKLVVSFVEIKKKSQAIGGEGNECKKSS